MRGRVTQNVIFDDEGGDDIICEPGTQALGYQWVCELVTDPIINTAGNK